MTIKKVNINFNKYFFVVIVVVFLVFFLYILFEKKTSILVNTKIGNTVSYTLILKHFAHQGSNKYPFRYKFSLWHSGSTRGILWKFNFLKVPRLYEGLNKELKIALKTSCTAIFASIVWKSIIFDEALCHTYSEMLVRLYIHTQLDITTLQTELLT